MFPLDPSSPAMALGMLLAKATLLLLVAFGAATLLQRAAAGARHLVWVAILGAVLFLPVLSAWSPLRLAILPSALVSPSAAAPALRLANGSSAASGVNSETPLPAQRDDESLAPAGPEIADVSAFAPTPWQLALIVWAVVALALGGWLAFGFASVRRIVRRATPLDGRAWTAPLYEIADRLGIDRTPRIVRSDDVKMPFAAGLLHPTIVLPAECERWDDERRSAVLMHELAHIKRRDLLGHTLGRITCAIYWFHPLVWRATRRLRIESERACDDLALTCGLRATSYAEHLLDIVSGIRQPRTPAVAIPMADRKEFEGRMLAILDPELRRRAGRWQSLSVVGALALLVLVVGGAVPAERALAMAQRSDESPFSDSVLGGGTDSVATHAVTHAVTQTAEVTREEARTRKSELRVERPEGPRSQPQVVDAVAPARPEPTPRASATPLALSESLQGKSGDERAALLIKVLRADTSAELRRVAAWGLMQYAERAEVAAALATALRGDRSATVREMSAWALGSGEDHGEAVAALAEAMRKDSDDEVRETAAWALGAIGAEDARTELVAALGDRSAGTRSMAMWALGNAGEGKAPPAVLDALQDSEPRVRVLAAWALFGMEDPASVPSLERALAQETDKSLRRAYIRALGAVGAESAGALARLLDSNDAELRAAVVEALAGRNGGPWPMPMPRPRPYP